MRKRSADDKFILGYCAAIADLFRLNGGSDVRAGELLRGMGGVAGVKGKGVCRADMDILRKIERVEGR